MDFEFVVSHDMTTMPEIFRHSSRFAPVVGFHNRMMDITRKLKPVCLDHCSLLKWLMKQVSFTVQHTSIIVLEYTHILCLLWCMYSWERYCSEVGYAEHELLHHSSESVVNLQWKYIEVTYIICMYLNTVR